MSDNKERLQEALQWLFEHSDEQTSTAARIFGLKPNTLQKAIRRTDKRVDIDKRVKKGGQNRVLTNTQIQVLKKWIIGQYEAGFGATRQMLFAAICHILPQDRGPPSDSWMTKFIREQTYRLSHN
jgi:transposase